MKRLLRSPHRPRHAFTLLELMVAFIIMAILSAIAVPSLLGVVNGDQSTADQTTALSLADQAYYLAASNNTTPDYSTIPLSVSLTSVDTTDYPGYLLFTFTDGDSICTTAPTQLGSAPAPSDVSNCGGGTTTTTTTPTYPMVVDSVNMGATVPAALTTAGGDVWVLNAVGDFSSPHNNISEINPTTDVVTQSVEVAPGAIAIAAAGGDLWIANNVTNQVMEYRESDLTLLNTVTVGNTPTAISVAAGKVWVANQGDGTVTELDATTAAEVGSPISVGSGPSSAPSAISADGTDVWVVNNGDGTVTEIDATTAAVVGSPIVVSDYPIGISSDGTAVWVSTDVGGTGGVTEIEASTGNIIGTTSGLYFPAGISSDGADVWTISSGGAGLYEIQASTGNLINTIPVGNNPYPVVSDGTDVWVGDQGDGDVWKVQIAP